ncbi:MAG: DUF4416 family protein [Elusimicrobiota bacterium]
MINNINTALKNAHHVQKVKLIAGLILAKEAPADEIKACMCSEFGDTDYSSMTIDFDYTDYYFKEMGRPLWRKFFSFRDLIDPTRLPAVKNITRKIEDKFSIGGNRTVNIDPGYLEPAKLVLASTKNFYHRIYIGDGIYAEVTLYWEKREFRTHKWTFPDYSSEIYRDILKQIREIYMKQYRSTAEKQG